MEWPDAVPVHIVRDGRDVATSQVEDFEWGYCSYPEAALEWSSFVQCVRELGTAIDICELTYEALVNDTQSTLQVLLNRLDLEWEDSIRNPPTIGLEHSAYFHGDVSHPSQQKVEGNIYTSAIGRYKDVMTEDIHNNFVRLAKDSLELHGYLHLPVVSIFAHRGPTPCNNLEACTKRSSSLLKSLVPRYISENWPTPNQVKTAILPLHFESYEDYCSSIKKIYKSQRVRDAKKAAEKGYFCQQFDRRLFVPDIVEINQSKERRSGGAMKESYLKSVDEMGGEPNQHFTLDAPACPAHYDSWWGAFLNEEGYKQGKILTGKQLCAYVNLRRNGNLAMYNLIIGHGRHLEYGVMPLLHLEIMNWILEQGNIYSQGLQYLGYAGYYQGGDGLRRWKKSFGFEPMYMRVGPW